MNPLLYGLRSSDVEGDGDLRARGGVQVRETVPLQNYLSSTINSEVSPFLQSQLFPFQLEKAAVGELDNRGEFSSSSASTFSSLSRPPFNIIPTMPSYTPSQSSRLSLNLSNTNTSSRLFGSPMQLEAASPISARSKDSPLSAPLPWSSRLSLITTPKVDGLQSPLSSTLDGMPIRRRASVPQVSNDPWRKRKCSFCGKGFCTRSAVERHERTHTGEAPFACHICGKRFKQKGTLQDHFLVHSSVRSFRCQNQSCNKTFRHRSSLHRHLERCNSKVDPDPGINLQVASNPEIDISSCKPAIACATMDGDSVLPRQALLL